MKKLILLGTLLAALLSIFAISALMVSAAPTPPSVRDMLARPTPRTNVADVSASVPANILRGISYTGTGQIITEAPCSINRRDVYAYPSTIPNNGTYAFELPLERSFDIIGLGTLPGLCTLQEVAPELFFVSSPDGEVLEPRVHRFLPQTGLRSNAATFYQLPIEALAQPGTWQIGISRGFVMNVEIPQAQRPF
jgi:hypothetical protein